jgi:phosphate-selective porin OprO and OprP
VYKIDHRKIMPVKSFFITIIMLFAFLQSQAQDLSKIVDDVSEMMNDTTVLNDEQVSTDAPPIMSNKWNQIHTKFFTLNIGLCVLFDYVILVQDSNNIQQVGKVEPATQFRADRIILSGNLLFFKKNPWHYMISANYNGLDAAQAGKPTFDFTDWNIEIPFGKTGGWLTIGKQKEGVGLEYVSPGTQGFFTERGSGVPMIVRQRNIGIRYSNSVLNQRLAYTIGLFNNYWETGKSFSENGSQITARITGLLHYVSDRELMHLGIGYRYTGSTDTSLSYKGKPEANTAPSFINTGSFIASSANSMMFEFIGVKGPVAVVGEYMQVFVNSNINSNPSFNYWQFGGSWFITGENRKYNKLNGNLGKLIPKKNFKFRKNSGPGAFELGARFTKSDFSDGTIQGGKFGRFTTALGWYPNAHFRFEVNYGYGSLDKNNLVGKSGFWQFRAQFEL